jgi:hypothetical protein
VRISEIDGAPCVIVNHGYGKRKVTGAKCEGWDRANCSYIIGTMEVKSITDYMALLPPPSSSGKDRFFVKLAYGKGKTIIGSKQVIGKNTASAIAYQVALMLKLEDPKRFTGHTFKRTSITWCADSGLTLIQIKAHTGHRSDSVVQGYVDQSMPQKLLAANAIAGNVAGGIITSPARARAQVSMGLEQNMDNEESIPSVLDPLTVGPSWRHGGNGNHFFFISGGTITTNMGPTTSVATATNTSNMVENVATEEEG